VGWVRFEILGLNWVSKNVLTSNCDSTGCQFNGTPSSRLHKTWPYLSHLLILYHPSRVLRSSSSFNFLQVPCTNLFQNMAAKDCKLLMLFSVSQNNWLIELRFNVPLNVEIILRKLEGVQRVHISAKYTIMSSCTHLHIYIHASLVMYMRSRRLPTITTSSLHACMLWHVWKIYRKWCYIFVQFSSTPTSILNLTISSESKWNIDSNDILSVWK